MPASCVLIGAQVRVHNPKELRMASVLITGTSKGIGLEAALAFGRAGHKVHATMRKPSQAPELAETAAGEKLPITVSAMDVDSDESVRQAIDAIQQAHGPIDVLVNNAGIERSGSVEELPLAEFRAVMETNYFGVIRINVSSVAGRISSSPFDIVYGIEVGAGSQSAWDVVY